MSDLSRFYRILEVEPGASREEVRRAYRDLAQIWHPDRFEGRPDLRSKAEARLKEINEAYRELSRAGFGEGRGEVPPRSAGAGGPAEGSGASRWSGSKRSGDPDRLGPVRRVRLWIGAWLQLGRNRRQLLIGAILVLPLVFAAIAAWVLRGHGLVTREGEPIRFVQVSAGGWHACGLDAAGSIYCWGADDVSQLGNGEGVDVCGGASSLPCSLNPRRVRATQRFVSVSAGWSHTCGLAETGELYCWGGGFAGQTGTGGFGDEADPTPVHGLLFRTISTLGQHTCGLTGDGDIYCWGNNESGQLGHTGGGGTCLSDSGPFPCAATPKIVEPDRTWSAVSAGGSHTCALTTAGQAFCWGSNRSGQLGSAGGSRCGSGGNEHNCRRMPRMVGHDGEFRAISAGAAHSCALAESGAAWCWGDNRFGQLGTATVQSSFTPVRAAGNHVFDSIEARGHQTCGVRVDGRTYCWGRVPPGVATPNRICSGDPCVLVPSPVRFPAGSEVAAGNEFACVLAGRYQRCWGRNDVGQLGVGSVTGVAQERRLEDATESPRRIRTGPLRIVRNHANSLLWAMRRFVTRLLAPILNELDRI